MKSSDSTANAPVLHHWTARKIPPVVLLYLTLVFLGFLALAVFVFHSPEAVKALLAAAVVAIVPVVPGVLNRLEFRMTDEAIEKRLLDPKNPKEFKLVVRLDDVSHLSPTSSGFKFFKPIPESGRIRRFLKRHLSDSYSGEFQVESEDRQAVSAVLTRRGVPIR